MSLPPKIDFIGFTDSYNDTFALIVEWNAAIVIVFSCFIFMVLKFINNYGWRNTRVFKEFFRWKMTRGKAIKKDIELMEQKQTSYQQDNNQSKQVVFQNQSQNLSCIEVCLSLLFYIICTLFAFLIINLYMFNLFGRGKIIDILTTIAVSSIFIIPITFRKYSQNNNFLKNSKKKKLYITQAIFWVVFSLAVVIMTKDICVCQFNTKYGYNLLEDSSLSTAFSRTMTLDTVCPNDKVCHFYATLPQDGSTSVFFNIHTGTNVGYLVVELLMEGDVIFKQLSASPYHFKDVQQTGQRMVHSLMFYQLTPYTSYEILVKDKQDKILKRTTYRTLPGKDAQVLKMAVGGDVGLSQAGQMMTSHLTAYDPDVIVIGGDVAYDDGMRTCYYSWDNFYDMFEKVFQNINRVIPMIMSMGNHDVGFDALKRVHVNKHPDSTLLFFLFNPQNLGLNRTAVPDNMERDSVHSHILGPVLMLNLDSGYVRKFDQQKETIKEISKKYPGYYRFANYHNPIYPSCADSDKNSNYQQIVTQGLLHWVPIFDQMNFTTVMEHHTHFRKMTYKLRNDTIDERGVRYIGDGSWGVPDDKCPYKVQTQRIQVMQDFTEKDPNHMWQVTLTRQNSNQYPYELNYTSVNRRGELILTKIDKLQNPPF